MKKPNTQVRKNGSANGAAKQASKTPPLPWREKAARRLKRRFNQIARRAAPARHQAPNKPESRNGKNGCVHHGEIKMLVPSMGFGFIGIPSELAKKLNLESDEGLLFRWKDLVDFSPEQFHTGDKVSFTVEKLVHRPPRAANVKLIQAVRVPQVQMPEPPAPRPSSVQPWHPEFPMHRRKEEALFPEISGVGRGSVSDEVALKFLCRVIERSSLRERLGAMEDWEAIELAEVLNIANMVVNNGQTFPACLPFPGLAGHKEMTHRTALEFVADQMYLHRALVLRLKADLPLERRLEFVEALVVAEAVLDRMGIFNVKKDTNGESALEKMAERMRADLLLGRRGDGATPATAAGNRMLESSQQRLAA